MSYPVFFIIALPLVIAALGVVFNRNPIRSALCLVMTLFLLAVQFVFLSAHLVAALQVIVYAGAIMVLFLFVIMLLNLQQETAERRRPGAQLVAVALAALFALALARTLWKPISDTAVSSTVPEGFGTTAALGARLFTHFVLPFEITSVLLLVAVVGAVVLAKRKVG
jgi:NADH-quinone oxidoreductase subunit J